MYATQVISAYTLDGLYIGDENMALFLCVKKGIKPELTEENNDVCCIGYSEHDNKWYGWSHRAIYGYGIGSKVKKGDCSYQASSEKDFALNK